jgi:DNA polymerase III gamma/tau subunit
MSADVFPEHRKIISELLILHSRGQLPHAVLITSVSGVGLASSATRLCGTLLCEQRHDEALRRLQQLSSCGGCNPR